MEGTEMKTMEEAIAAREQKAPQQNLRINRVEAAAIKTL